MYKWKFGVYLRLSSDEKKYNNESLSISNQRDFINYYLSKYKDSKIYKEYIDDGYTGTDFNRPGFQQMIDDVNSKKINAIIVKDLSRLGRNYILVGNFFDNFVDAYNIRFISINDSVDSYEQPKEYKNLQLYIQSMMNEGYSKDISKKIRTAFKTLKKNGNYIGVVAPFGYLKDPNDCHKFIIDSNAKQIVNRIFHMASIGLSKKQIMESLNADHILTPSDYFEKILNNKVGVQTSRIWSIRMIDDILKNETYIGNLVQGKMQRVNHKTHNIVRVPENEWIIYKNHHEPIIDEKIFYQVQDIIYNRNKKVTKTGNYAIYSGHIKCADCGCNLYRKTKKENNKSYYYCGTYIRNKQCTKHYITEEEINTAVLNAINKFIELLSNLKEKVEKAGKLSSIEYNKDIKNIKIVEIDKKIAELELLLNDLLNDYKSDVISESDFNDFNQNYMFDLNNLRLEKEELEKSNNYEFDLKWLKEVKLNNEIKTINKQLVDEYIDNILVDENKNVKIIFKFSKPYNDAIEFFESKV